jgi:hypothetical protein
MHDPTHDVDVGRGEKHEAEGSEVGIPERAVQSPRPRHGALDEIAIASLVERQDLVAEPDRGGGGTGLGALVDEPADE